MNFLKKTRWFTLVEMLIVIVIIWVLAAALIPRLTSVRWRANDVARKADLQQVATAIVSYSMDKGKYPDCAINTWCDLESLSWALIEYVTILPKDPQKNPNYTYILSKKWWINSWWFILISKAETAWWANRAFSWATDLLSWWSDTQNITPCSVMSKSWAVDLTEPSECYYENVTQLRYIIAR